MRDRPGAELCHQRGQPGQAGGEVHGDVARHRRGGRGGRAATLAPRALGAIPARHGSGTQQGFFFWNLCGYTVIPK